MEKKDKRKIFIVLGILLIVLIPLLKAKLPIEAEAEIVDTEYKRTNGLI